MSRNVTGGSRRAVRSHREIVERKESSESYLDRLPTVLLEEIFMKMSIEEITRSCTVSRRFEEICEHEYLWRRKLLENYGVDERFMPTWRKTAIEILRRFKQVSVGDGNHAAALRYDGSLVSWGHNDADWHSGGKPISDTPKGTNFKQVSAGLSHSIALREDGSLVSWGNDIEREVRGTPKGTGFKQVSAGGDRSIAIREDGSLESWGYEENIYGETEEYMNLIAEGMEDNWIRPEGTGFKQISAGWGHSLALREDGSIGSWGEDDFKQVSGTPRGTGFKQVSAGLDLSIALRENGTLVSWGSNNHGLISDAPRGTGFKQVSAGGTHCLALTENGSIEAWGNDDHRQISDTPEGTGFRQVSAGNNFSSAIRRDRTLTSWGIDEGGEVSNTPRS